MTECAETNDSRVLGIKVDIEDVVEMGEKTYSQVFDLTSQTIKI